MSDSRFGWRPGSNLTAPSHFIDESRRWWLAVSALLPATVLTRLPLRSRVPINWDAVQYVLGVRHFDVAANPLFWFYGEVALF